MPIVQFMTDNPHNARLLSSGFWPLAHPAYLIFPPGGFYPYKLLLGQPHGVAPTCNFNEGGISNSAPMPLCLFAISKSRTTKMNFIKKLSLLILISTLITSCVSNKKFVYLQDKGNVKLDSNGVFHVQPYAYKLQKGDVLFISLTTDDDKLNKIFVPSAGGQNLLQNTNISGTMLYYAGFTIDNQGEIEFPYLGKIKVSEMEVEQAKTAIETQLKRFLKYFFFRLKWLNLNFLFWAI